MTKKPNELIDTIIFLVCLAFLLVLLYASLTWQIGLLESNGLTLAQAWAVIGISFIFAIAFAIYAIVRKGPIQKTKHKTLLVTAIFLTGSLAIFYLS